MFNLNEILFLNANYCFYIIYDTLSGCAEQLDVNIENID